MLVRPINEQDFRNFPLDDYVIDITEQDVKDLATCKKIFSSEQYEEEEIKYMEQVEAYEYEVDDVEKPIYDDEDNIIGYEQKIVRDTRTTLVEDGTQLVIKTRPILIKNPNYDKYISEQNKKQLQAEKQGILNWLYENDWKVNKIVIGEWKENDKRWTEYLEERAIKRARLDEIEAILNDSENI